jgi:hypothetical protein
MDTKPVLATFPIGMNLAAAGLAISIAIGLLIGVAGLFLQEGTPLQNVVIAERACRELAFQSERDGCVRSFLAASYHRRLASR